MDELKPCKCGQLPKVIYGGDMTDFLWLAGCIPCQIDVTGETKEAAIAAWNRRAPTNTGEDTTAGAIRQSGEEGK